MPETTHDASNPDLNGIGAWTEESTIQYPPASDIIVNDDAAGTDSGYSSATDSPAN